MKRQPIDLYSGPTMLAIDVSAHQGTIDWGLVARSEAMLNGRSQGRPELVIVRSGDGLRTRPGSQPDPMAVRNLRGAHEAGLACALYHYVRADHDPIAQVEIVLEVIAVAGVPVVFVALDKEGRPDDPRTHEDEAHGTWQELGDGDPTPDTVAVLRCLATMRAELERRSRRVLIYSGVSWHWYVAQSPDPEVHALAAEWADVPLWTPCYTSEGRPRMPVGPRGEPSPWATWTLWQYSSKGRIDGISGSVDLNRFRGDREAFDTWSSAPTARGFALEQAELLRELEALQLRYGDRFAVVLREARVGVLKVHP